MDAWPGEPPLKEWQEDVRDWVAANDGCRREVLALLRAEGPTAARDIPDTCEVPWRSTGWTNDKNVMKLLECMESRGEVAVASREGRERRWDLAERIHPGDPAVPVAEAHLELRGASAARAGHRPTARAGGVGREARRARRRARRRASRAYAACGGSTPTYLDDDFEGRTAILSPLDRLVFDRKRMEDVFDFDYQLEMYKPAAKRQWGYWAMPVLDGDELVGKVDATADREGGVLVVDAVHEDGDWSAAPPLAGRRRARRAGGVAGLEVVRS